MSESTASQRPPESPNVRAQPRRFTRSSLAAAMFVMTSALIACSEPAAETTADDTAASNIVALTSADVADARMDTIAGGLQLSGALEPVRSVQLTAQLDGTMASVTVDRGSPVRRGQLLATITADGVREQAASSASAIAAAKAGVAVAEQRRDGARALFAKGAIAQMDLRAAEAQYEAAVAEMVRVQAGAASAREAASRTRIVSPLDGIVSERAIEAGEPVSNGDPILTVVDVRTLELAGRVGVDVASQLAVGMTVEFEVESRQGTRFSGRVARIDPVADAGTRQVGVYVQLPNAERQLTAGQYATGRVLLDSPSALVVVPSAALRERNGTAMVAVVAEGRIRMKTVQVATRDDARGLVGIASGLGAGERVLVMPGAGLEDGTLVRMVDTTTPNDSGRPPVAPVGGQQ